MLEKTYDSAVEGLGGGGGPRKSWIASVNEFSRSKGSWREAIRGM